MAFRVEIEKNGEKATIVMSGSIDEDTHLPKIDLSGIDSRIAVDLENVTHINSVGIRSWLEWFKTLGANKKFFFQRCPRSVVMQMNMVDGFLPPSSMVESFYVPFFCESCNQEILRLFKLGKDVVKNSDGTYEINFDHNGICKSGECEIVLDAHEAKYFRFLSLLKS
jgi:anti-anti-sigma regulatory factor